MCNFFLVLAALGLCCYARTLKSLAMESGAALCCGARASRRGGFSWWSIGSRCEGTALVAVHGLGSRGARA